MNSSIKFLSGLFAFGLAASAAANITGTQIPAALSVENIIGVYSAALLLLLATRDYSRRTVALQTPAAAIYTLRARELNRLAA